MMRTALVTGVTTDQLPGEIGKHKPQGWEIRQLIPTAWVGGAGVQHVTHWTIVLESERPLPPGGAG